MMDVKARWSKGGILILKSIISSIKQALSGRAFLLSVVGVTVLLFLSSVQNLANAFSSEKLLMGGFHHSFVMDALASDSMMLALPILSALPFTSSMVDDVKCGFIKEYLPRTTVNGYIIGKVVACILSGGLVFVVGILAAYGISALIFMPMEAAGSEMTSNLEKLMGQTCLFFVSGGFWAMVGMLFATLTESKYMAYASPFVFCYVLIILYERYFDTLYVFYPKEWIMPSQRWMFGNTSVILFVSELIVITALCFGITAKRRLSKI